MRVVLQRTRSASVIIDGHVHAEIDHGLLILLGIETMDTIDDIGWLCKKVTSLRIFSDDEGKMNISINDVQGDILVISQFTLHASTKKGNRPSFIAAALPGQAVPLYELFISTLQHIIEGRVKTGVFGSDMQVQLINDGPVTIIIDSKLRE